MVSQKQLLIKENKKYPRQKEHKLQATETNLALHLFLSIKFY